MKLTQAQKNNLTDCFYCGKRSAIEKTECPYCGRPKREELIERRLNLKGAMPLIFRLVLWFLVMSLIVLVVALKGS